MQREAFGRVTRAHARARSSAKAQPERDFIRLDREILGEKLDQFLGLDAR
jgi:hypothetical protein